MPRFRITTPEQVAFHYVIAGPITRCLAWLIDEAIVVLGYLVIIYIGIQMNLLIGVAMVYLCWLLLDFSYFALFELYSAGQSPGKRLFHIRVICANGSRLRFVDVMIRSFLRPIDQFPVAMILGGCVMGIDRWHRRLGDLAADTLVVRDVRRALPQALDNAKTRVNSFHADVALRNRILARISREERDLVLDLALRRDQMDPAVREQLFSQAASHFRTWLALPTDLHYISDEQTVVNLALVVQDAKFTA